MTQDMREMIAEAFQVDIYNHYTIDVQAGTLYDTYSSNFLCNFEFFSGQLDQRTYDNALLSTNVFNPRRLPAPEQFSISKISFACLADCDPIAKNIIENEAVFELHLGHKYYLRAPLGSLERGSYCEAPTMRRCDYCSSVYVPVLTNCPTCGASKFSIFLGDIIRTPDSDQMYMEVKPKIVIPQQMEFFVRLIVPTSAHQELKVRLRCWLSGLHARGVQ